MNRWTGLLGVFVVALLAVGGLSGDDQKTTPTRYRGVLPPNWKKLGLSDQQKQQIYKIQTSYRPKIDDLQNQLRQLKEKERGEMEKVLTAAQKDRLRQILLERSHKDTSSKGGTDLKPIQKKK